MTVEGVVKGGKLVLRDPLPFAEGTRVSLRPVGQPTRRAKRPRGAAAFLMRHAGKIKDGFPTDLSVNHDHYLYGVPKKHK